MSERNVYELHPFKVNITRKLGRVLPNEMVGLDDGTAERMPVNMHGALKVGSRVCVEYAGRARFVGTAEPWHHAGEPMRW